MWCSKEQILPFDWGMGAKTALIRGRLIYSLFKHLHGYFVINQTKSLIPQYPTPNISQPSLGVHASSLDTAGKLASHQRSTGTPQLPAPLKWGESKLGAVSPSTPTETGATREEIPRFLTATVRKSDTPEVYSHLQKS